MSNDASPDGGVHASPDASAVARAELPNARVQLRLRFRAPGLPERTIDQTIWLRGSRFRVRDDAGRAIHEIVGDVTYPRGLGLPARSMEEIMDRRAAARRAPTGATEVFGDLASDEGWVYPPNAARWAKPAHELAPVARQVLVDDRAASLAASGSVTRLARAATEYRGTVAAPEDGATFDNVVVRVVAPPFLLLDDVRSAASAEHFYVREVVALETDVVTDADVSPPPP